MDFATIIGLLFGSGLIGYAVFEVSQVLPNGVMTFVDVQSLMIVLGGTIAPQPWPSLLKKYSRCIPISGPFLKVTITMIVTHFVN
jgi:hypothetical protein